MEKLVAKNKEPKVKKERFKTLKQIGQTYTITRQTDKSLPFVILGTLIGTTVPLLLIVQIFFQSSFSKLITTTLAVSTGILVTVYVFGKRAEKAAYAQLKGVTSAAAATDGYVTSLQAASEKVSSLSEAYERASVSIAGLTSNTAEGESFGEQMQKVSKNLAALNNVYELQLKGSTSHLEATEKFQSQVVEMMANLSASAEDTRVYKENMSLLSKNLTDLNNVYGNMLKAMRA